MNDRLHVRPTCPRQDASVGGLFVIALLLASVIGLTPGVSWSAPQTDPQTDSQTTPRWTANRTATRITISGCPPKWLAKLSSHAGATDQVLKVFVGTADQLTQDQPAVLGRATLMGQQLVFTPRFPLAPRASYTAVLDLPQLDPQTTPVRITLASTHKPGKRPFVSQVYPTSSVLPQNQLKFYIQFSQPMGRGYSYRNIHLIGDDGREIEFPFLEIDEELWSPDGRRFTLLFDPGRIKQGLVPREEMGPALEAGRAYRLVIDSAWKDDQEQPLLQGFEKSFRVIEPDTQQPDLKQWRLSSPEVDTRNPLQVEFKEPLDFAMLQHVIQVFQLEGQALAGSIRVSNQEQRWEFVPSQPWKAGRYRLSVSGVLEDRAGNSLARPFEVDQFRRIDKSVPTRKFERTFEIR